ncbi:unnamed protein product (mitochondrion) [Plasmodiophora brassicae]|uniref:AP2/ERF domain-containing protein n=1 Tax=Plasmodiophora brassicae TaxID=37360 RepID=A0A0G4ISS7_PLABS|nr:hypothetical protein PBRA_006527 [Plasmodiophora brassicae]SPQ94499.1 unnamed protein product [Plasmodiophora brassicae]
MVAIVLLAAASLLHVAACNGDAYLHRLVRKGMMGGDVRLQRVRPLLLAVQICYRLGPDDVDPWNVEKARECNRTLHRVIGDHHPVREGTFCPVVLPAIQQFYTAMLDERVLTLTERTFCSASWQLCGRPATFAWLYLEAIHRIVAAYAFPPERHYRQTWLDEARRIADELTSVFPDNPGSHVVAAVTKFAVDDDMDDDSVVKHTLRALPSIRQIAAKPGFSRLRDVVCGTALEGSFLTSLSQLENLRWELQPIIDVFEFAKCRPSHPLTLWFIASARRQYVDAIIHLDKATHAIWTPGISSMRIHIEFAHAVTQSLLYGNPSAFARLAQTVDNAYAREQQKLSAQAVPCTAANESVLMVSTDRDDYIVHGMAKAVALSPASVFRSVSFANWSLQDTRSLWRNVFDIRQMMPELVFQDLGLNLETDDGVHDLLSRPSTNSTLRYICQRALSADYDDHDDDRVVILRKFCTMVQPDDSTTFDVGHLSKLVIHPDIKWSNPIMVLAFLGTADFREARNWTSVEANLFTAPFDSVNDVLPILLSGCHVSLLQNFGRFFERPFPDALRRAILLLLDLVEVTQMGPNWWMTALQTKISEPVSCARVDRILEELKKGTNDDARLECIRLIALVFARRDRYLKKAISNAIARIPAAFEIWRRLMNFVAQLSLRRSDKVGKVTRLDARDFAPMFAGQIAFLNAVSSSSTLSTSVDDALLAVTRLPRCPAAYSLLAARVALVLDSNGNLRNVAELMSDVSATIFAIACNDTNVWGREMLPHAEMCGVLYDFHRLLQHKRMPRLPGLSSWIEAKIVAQCTSVLPSTSSSRPEVGGSSMRHDVDLHVSAIALPLTSKLAKRRQNSCPKKRKPELLPTPALSDASSSPLLSVVVHCDALDEHIKELVSKETRFRTLDSLLSMHPKSVWHTQNPRVYRVRIGNERIFYRVVPNTVRILGYRTRTDGTYSKRTQAEMITRATDLAGSFCSF